MAKRPTYYTIADLARLLGRDHETIRTRWEAGTYKAQAFTASGRPLFSERYAQELAVSDQRHKVDAPK